MNRQQAAEFVHALNMIQPHVSPLLFGNLAGSDAVRVIVAIANNQVSCDLKPIATGIAPAGKGDLD
jgi:hypothetical protein